jgi:hypothetical protein
VILGTEPYDTIRKAFTKPKDYLAERITPSQSPQGEKFL